MKSKFFTNLPRDIQKKYVKLHAFYVTSKDPKLRLCPSEKCEQGILELNSDGEPITCNKCQNTFCSKCFFVVHEGDCDKNELEFFENNLHYRQCSNCKNVIEKNQGCNHITCRCGHQFCYICGELWNDNGHLCPNNGQNGEGNNQQQENNEDVPRCCVEMCGCLNEEGWVFKVMKFFYILLVCFPLFIVGMGMLMAQYALIISLTIFFTILLGIST